MQHQAPPQSGCLASPAPAQTIVSLTARTIVLVAADVNTVKMCLSSAKEVSAYLKDTFVCGY